MLMKRATLATLLLLSPAPGFAQLPTASESQPLAIGTTFTIESRVLGETRRINVYAPADYSQPGSRLPVLYMPDGGIGEDFLHVAGLVQISALNGTMRPFLLVGIENTQRRRDLTGPTDSARDRAIAPQVGGSAAFRRFIRSELMPLIEARYRTTDETAIVGESLAGLFVVETFFLEPDLFDTYIAFDPSLWWNGAQLVNTATERLRARPPAGKTLYLANSSEPDLARLTGLLADMLKQHARPGLVWHHRDLAQEGHATIYHPAALEAFRLVFRPK
jgi:predicted alpha/beta superfamily hydrolase